MERIETEKEMGFKCLAMFHTSSKILFSLLFLSDICKIVLTAEDPALSKINIVSPLVEIIFKSI
jgi:hypothetical protein